LKQYYNSDGDVQCADKPSFGHAVGLSEEQHTRLKKHIEQIRANGVCIFTTWAIKKTPTVFI